MMSSLFEIYDPFSFFLSLSLNWVLCLFCLLMFCVGYWSSLGLAGYAGYLMFSFLSSEFSLFFTFKALKWVSGLFVFLFVYLLFCNLLGLFPYVFSVSAHFVFCLSYSLPIWLGSFVFGWFNMPNKMFIHLIPLSTPTLLISFMALIETISQLIRPWSLAIRLMANMISGHLLLSLLGGCGGLSLAPQFGLFVFEFFVCFIQAYVFCALLVLYYSEL